MLKLTLYSLLLINQGCAVHYYDPQTGADHIWGVGHLAMKSASSSDAKQVLITQKTLAGVTFGFEGAFPSFNLGWNQSERITVHSKNTSLAIERPSNDYLQFKFAASPEDLKNNNK